MRRLPSSCLVAASLGGFTAPLVHGDFEVASIALLNPMIPSPGETPGAWWDNVGAVEARIEAAQAGGYPVEFNLGTYFFHDVPSEVLVTGTEKVQSEGPFASVCDFDSWQAPVRVITGKDDRFFPSALQQGLARERIGVEPLLIPGGHLAALSRPVEVTEALLSFDI